MARPKKTQLPVSLETILRVALPKKRPEDRMKIFREWARCNLTVKLWRQPTADECQADFELWNQKQYNHLAQIDSISVTLKDFVPKYAAENRKKRALIAATKRWSKKK